MLNDVHIRVIYSYASARFTKEARTIDYLQASNSRLCEVIITFTQSNA